jgi:hypothetical protein
MYLLNDNSIDKSNVCISTKVNISTLKYIFVFKTLNDILYIKFIKNEFLQHHYKYKSSYSPKKQIIPHNTSNLHENAPLPLLT